MSGGAVRGMMPGSEQPVTSSAATEKSGSQRPNASSAHEYARATAGHTSAKNTALGARMSELVPSSDVQEGPATRRPPQKKVWGEGRERGEKGGAWYGRRASGPARACAGGHAPRRARTHVVARPVLVDPAAAGLRAVLVGSHWSRRRPRAQQP